MKSEQIPRMSFICSDKNKAYMAELGFLDKRNFKARNKVLNVSRFINECITLVCEMKKHPERGFSSHNDLKAAYRKLEVARRNKEIDRLQQEIQSIVDWKG